VKRRFFVSMVVTVASAGSVNQRRSQALSLAASCRPTAAGIGPRLSSIAGASSRPSRVVVFMTTLTVTATSAAWGLSGDALDQGVGDDLIGQRQRGRVQGKDLLRRGPGSSQADDTVGELGVGRSRSCAKESAHSCRGHRLTRPAPVREMLRLQAGAGR